MKTIWIGTALKCVSWTRPKDWTRNFLINIISIFVYRFHVMWETAVNWSPSSDTILFPTHRVKYSLFRVTRESDKVSFDCGVEIDKQLMSLQVTTNLHAAYFIQLTTYTVHLPMQCIHVWPEKLWLIHYVFMTKGEDCAEDNDKLISNCW